MNVLWVDNYSLWEPHWSSKKSCLEIEATKRGYSLGAHSLAVSKFFERETGLFQP